MRTDAQREASRKNGAKSRGPKSPEGKNRSRFNGVTHGLCAKHVVLPGEDPAAFDAEKQAWIDDWRPASYTRAVLVERAAVASWRLRRAVRAESALLGERADIAVRDFDLARFARVDRAMARIDNDPRGTVTLLELDATGLDRLLGSCGELARALEAGAAGWNQPVYHTRLMLLLGFRPDEDPSFAGAVPRASARLLAANDADYAANPGLGHCVVVHPLPRAEFDTAVEDLRRAVAAATDRLVGLRRAAPDPDDLRRRAVAAAYADGSEEGKLRHRYEMAIDRSLRATIGQLIVLEKSGADLGGDAEDFESEDDAVKEVRDDDGESAGSSSASEGEAAPGSLGAGTVGVIPGRVAAVSGGLEASETVAARGGGGRSRG